MRIIIILISCTFLFVQCKEPIDIQAEVDANLAIKIERYKQVEIDKCRLKANEAAETHVDSVISQWVSFKLVDTMKIPNKPNRPSSPEHILGSVDTFTIE